jgi:hypothetical protein
MMHVFMSFSVECKLKTWKTTIGKRKKSKLRLSGALSQKNVSFGLRNNNKRRPSTVKLFSSFALLLTLFEFVCFSLHEMERNGRKAIDKEDYERVARSKLLSRRESFSRCLFWIDCDHCD